MSWEEFSRINVRAPKLAGVTADMGEVRVYPYGGAFAHVIGYVAKPNDKDIKSVKRRARSPTRCSTTPASASAVRGWRRRSTADLRGKAGAQKQEVDSKGRVVRQDPAARHSRRAGQGNPPDPRRRHPEPRAGGLWARNPAPSC
jgi:penicillin-binding protein 2